MRLVPFRVLSLRAVLALLPLVAVLPMVLFALFLLNRVWEEGRTNGELDLQQLLQIQTLALERELETHHRELRMLSDTLLHHELDLAEFRADADRALGYNPIWDSLTLTDPRGRAVAQTQVASVSRTKAPVLSDAAAAHVQGVLSTGFPAHSDGLHDSGTGHVRVGVAVPVLSDRTVVGVIHAELRPLALSAILAPQSDDSLFVTLLDRQYRVIARNRDAQRYLGSFIGAQRQALMLAQPREGAAQTENLSGQPYRVHWQQMSNGWTVVVGEDASLATQPLRRSLMTLLIVGLALLVLGIVASRIAGRYLERQVGSLKQHAARLAAGESMETDPSRITEVEALRQALLEAADRLAHVQAARERAIQALEQADHRKDEFLAMLAHELRNPMAPLRNALALLQARTRDDPLSQRMVALGDRQLGHLIRLVDDLLDVARISRGRLELRLQSLVLQEVLQEAADSLHDRLMARAQPLRLQCPRDAVVIQADRVRLVQIIENLLSNASKYSDSGQPIDLTVSLSANHVQIRVTDQGIGLQPDELEPIFELYRQVDDGVNRSQGGLGIGLALVRRLVMLHGGTVMARSDGPGRGSCFEILLPHRS